MVLSEEIKIAIQNSVLCWLATSDGDNFPNVSPKEIFIDYKDEYILVANIASLGTIKNIKVNSKVCISFIDILVQKGFQLKGMATIIEKEHPDYADVYEAILPLTGNKFPILSVIKIKISSSKPIMAPSYLFYPDTLEEDQIAKAKEQYKLK